MIELRYKTPQDWAPFVINNFNEFLIDHVDCERKASAMALHFVAKCPDRTEWLMPLTNLALEELQHFKQAAQILLSRGLRLSPQMTEDVYVNRLLSACRPSPEDRLLDRLIVVSVVESRGAERFGLVAKALEDPLLKNFYEMLHHAETKHGSLFIQLARSVYSEDHIQERIQFFDQHEESILNSLPWRHSLH